MNDYSQNSYRPHEYFSVSRGPVFANGKHKILINEGAIRHFTGRAERVSHGLRGPRTSISDPIICEDVLLEREDVGIKNETIVVPRQSYSESLLVGDGDKLYLKCESSLVVSILKLPIVIEVNNRISEDYRDVGSMEIKMNTFSDFTVDYSIERDYLDSFESDNLSGRFNFLIAEFYKTGKRLIKKQRHSGIIFLPRVFRMKANNDNDFIEY